MSDEKPETTPEATTTEVDTPEEGSKKLGAGGATAAVVAGVVGAGAVGYGTSTKGFNTVIETVAKDKTTEFAKKVIGNKDIGTKVEAAADAMKGAIDTREAAQKLAQETHDAALLTGGAGELTVLQSSREYGKASYAHEVIDRFYPNLAADQKAAIDALAHDGDYLKKATEIVSKDPKAAELLKAGDQLAESTYAHGIKMGGVGVAEDTVKKAEEALKKTGGEIKDAFKKARGTALEQVKDVNVLQKFRAQSGGKQAAEVGLCLATVAAVYLCAKHIFGHRDKVVADRQNASGASLGA